MILYIIESKIRKCEPMEVKKRFKLVDNFKEEAFLNDLNEKGYLLQTFDGESYQFSQTDNQYYYLVEFFYKELENTEITNYKKQGYSLVTTFKSSVKGYYYYFVNKDKVKDLDRNLKDRYHNLMKSKTRVDRFTSIIFVSAFGLFTFWYFQTFNELYIFVLLLIVLLGGYFGHIYIETIKRLDQYAKIIVEKDGGIDGNNERRS